MVRVGTYDSDVQTVLGLGPYESGAQTCADGGSTYRNVGMKVTGPGRHRSMHYIFLTRAAA